MKFYLQGAVALLGLSLSGISLAEEAQDVPQGTVKQDAASSGKTDVAGGGAFEAAAKREKAAQDAKDVKDATEAKILAGGLLSTGNSRSLATTASGQLRARRDQNQLSAAAAVNYGRAAPNADADVKTNVENYQGKLRYDRFITDDFSAFLSISGRRDRFQGLDLRLNLDPGVAYYFLNSAASRLWGEIGYDLQYDVRRQEVLDATPSLEKTETRSAVRLFAGAEQKFNDNVALNTGVEYLQGVGESKNWRLNWDAGLTSKVSDNFSLATTFTLRYDNNPLPNIKKTDTVTSVSLIYQLL
jgi:putative salt-induced outer membrane protein